MEIMVMVYPTEPKDYNILRTVLKSRRTKVTRLPRGICLLMPRRALSLYYVARLIKTMGSEKLTIKWIEKTFLEEHIPAEVWEMARKQKLSRANMRRLSRLKEEMLCP